MDPVRHDAIVLAGGGSTRFGRDKLAAVVDGVTLLDRVLNAAAAAEQRIVVGSRRPAADLPYVNAGTLTRLLEAGAGGDGALLVDEAGRRQLLCSAVRADALRERAAGSATWHGCSLRSLLDGLRLVEVPAVAGEARDVDVPDDLPQEAR
jgi:CTP:molybdopterin cytidylyltransferase MocA